MIQHLRQAVEKNLELRVKYPDEPLKFMDSEIELDESIKALEILSTEPQFLTRLLDHDIVPALTELLVHENLDIAMETVHLVSELVDSDTLVDAGGESVENEEVEAAKGFVESLYTNGFFSTLLTLLPRMEENADESYGKCVYDALSIFENLFDADPKHAGRILEARVQIVEFLLQRILYNTDSTKSIALHNPPPNTCELDTATFPVNRHYASELLFTICQYGGE
uniref:Beta-catenin-like protein 1 n=1 Tax=Lygus hesperus TaxID=30085 RepID=A0A0A9XTQ2_LYGHE